MKTNHQDDRKMHDSFYKNMSDFLSSFNKMEREDLFRILRKEFPIHELEIEFGCPAEVILEAISRGTDLTKRGVRGLIAEAYFSTYIIDPLLKHEWLAKAIQGDQPYDSLIEDNAGEVRIQIKMQRKKNHKPMLACEGPRKLFANAANMWIVETQKTRSGKSNNGQSTRPYRFGEFDILAVSLQPSTGNWSNYLYTVANWLLPDVDDATCIYKFQPVPKHKTNDWTDNILECIDWFRSGKAKTIACVTE